MNRLFVNGFRSREFRYLGAIGYFDVLYLSPHEGRKEIWLAVSESFGGWGVKARLDSMEGVTTVAR